jgi:ABC-2 type transport system ATP-binding protein
VDGVAIRARGLTKRFGKITALADLELDLFPGEVLGYLGPNGAGKTTTLRLLLGLLRPTSGRASIFGLDAGRDARAAHRLLAYVPGEVSLWPTLSGAETLELLGKLHGAEDPAYRAALVEHFDLDPSRRVRDYSKGNRQKLALIAALATRAPLLLLDEPTSGLDPLMEQQFRVCVREAVANGQAVLLSSHILSEVEALCDRVAILRDGRLVDSGTMQQLRHLSTTTLIATFSGAVPDLTLLPGVRSAEVTGHQLTCRVDGSVEPALRALVGSGLVRLVSREPSLEELFLTHYANAPAGTPVAAAEVGSHA